MSQIKEEQQKTTVFVGLLLALIGVVGLILGFALGEEITALTWVNTIPKFLALAGAAAYFLRGFSKDSARYMKFYLYLYAVVLAVTFVGALVLPLPHEIRMMYAMATGFSLVVVLLLAFVKDLGKPLSYTLFSVIVILDIFMVLTSAPLVRDGALGVDLLLYNVSELVLSVILWAMVRAKYLDKESRGTN